MTDEFNKLDFENYVALPKKHVFRGWHKTDNGKKLFVLTSHGIFEVVKSRGRFKLSNLLRLETK